VIVRLNFNPLCFLQFNLRPVASIHQAFNMHLSKERVSSFCIKMYLPSDLIDWSVHTRGSLVLISWSVVLGFTARKTCTYLRVLRSEGETQSMWIILGHDVRGKTPTSNLPLKFSVEIGMVCSSSPVHLIALSNIFSDIWFLDMFNTISRSFKFKQLFVCSALLIVQ
jgi:hypothetical protein